MGSRTKKNVDEVEWTDRAEKAKTMMTAQKRMLWIILEDSISNDEGKIAATS